MKSIFIGLPPAVSYFPFFKQKIVQGKSALQEYYLKNSRLFLLVCLILVAKGFVLEKL